MDTSPSAHCVEFGLEKQTSPVLTGVLATSLTDAIAGREGRGGGAGGDVRNDKVTFEPALARPASASVVESANHSAEGCTGGDLAKRSCSTTEIPVTFESLSFSSRMDAIGETATSNIGAKGGCKWAGRCTCRVVLADDCDDEMVRFS